MKTKKIIIAGVAISILDSIVGAVMCGGIFNWVYKLEPTNVWKPMGDAPGLTYFIGLLLLNFIFTAVYASLKEGIFGKDKFIKGLVFGLYVWLVGMLPGMFATYMFMTVAPTVIIYWTILALIQTPLKGLLTSSIYGE